VSETKPSRIPKVGDKIIFQCNPGDWIEAEVITIATDRYGEVGRVKLGYTGMFGLEGTCWALPFDICYLDGAEGKV
jgi:hypothetical protein